MNDYDVREIFEQMELELIASMKRNLSRHQKWEKDEGINWTMWQVEQLKTLEKFKQENKEIFTKRFTSVNNEIAKFLEDNYKIAGFDQEKAILQELSKGNIFNQKYEKGLEGGFFNLNEDKMNALINATTKDMTKAEHAMLRMVNDQYRKTIFKAQVMSNSGAFTLKQSIDMATKDFLKAGINCIQYKDGRRVNIASYAEMCIRTSTKRAKLVSEGDARKAYGIHTVRISKYGQCSETCLPWQGKVYVDDVFSGGTKEEAESLNLPLLSVAIAGGLFHTNCKHTMTTYFYDIKKSLGKLQDDVIENPPEEQEHRKNQLHIQQQKRIETGSIDPQNIELARQRKEQWIEKDNALYENATTEHSLLKRIGDNVVDFSIINSDDYRNKFTRITKSTIVNDSIRKYSKSILIHRSNSDYEDLYIISGKSGKLLFRNVKSKNALEVSITKEELQKLKKLNEPLIGIHNHPTNILPTGSDFVAAGYRGYEFGIVVTHDGKIYKYAVGNKTFLPKLLDERVDKYMKNPYNFSIDKAQIKALNEFRKEYGITWEEIKIKY